MSKALPFLAAAFGSIEMLANAVALISIRRFVADTPHDTYFVLPGFSSGLSPSILRLAFMLPFLISLLVLIAGATLTLAVHVQNRDTSRPASRRGASKKKDVLNAVHAIFDFVSLLVPQRLAKEELGDALEVINREIAKGRPRWRIWLKVATTLFWITINSLRWIRGVFRGRRKPR